MSRERLDHEARLRAMLDTAVEGIIAIDEEGVVESFNSAAERIFGYGADEVIGRNVTLLMPSPYREAHDEYLAAYRSTGMKKIIGIGREVSGRRKDGTLFPLDLSVGEVVLGDRRIFTGFVRDISERKRLEQEVVQSQKLEAVGSLAYGIAHDFNNLLMGILACSRVAREELGDNPAVVELFTEIGDAANRGIALTRQLLSFSRGRSEKLGPTSIDGVIRKNEVMLRQLLGEDILLRTELAQHGAHILADEGLIEQVLINLLVNARDAMPSGGEIVVTTRELEGPACQVLLQVRDTGCGIPPELCTRIFEPFFTTKEIGKGTGLGLSTVKRIVGQLSGRIEVESEVGRGAAFRLLFQRCEPPAAALVPAGGAPNGKPARMTLLLVEDDRLVRTSIRRYLEGQGYRVLAAEGSSEAVAAACANPAIDVLLTDMILPGSGGNELAQEILARVPRVRVIFMSAHAAEFLVEQGRLKPGDRYLQKPFELEELMRMLADVLATTDRNG